MKLFVRNLPFQFGDEQLKELFEQVGEVIKANIAKDRYTGKSRGFGFVEMASQEDGKKAIDQLSGTTVDGREIVVDIARDSSDRPKARH